MSQTMTQRSPANARKGSRGRASGPPQRENLGVWAFDSAGDRKYALQIQKAKNGNPCLRIIEGRPQQDGTFRKFDLTVWSEDFQALFAAMDEVRDFIRENDIKTPKGHSWKPGGRKSGGRRPG